MSKIKLDRLSGGALRFAERADAEGPETRVGHQDRRLDHFEATRTVEKLGVELEAELGARPEFETLMRHFRGNHQVTGEMEALTRSPPLEAKAEEYFYGLKLQYETTSLLKRKWRSLKAWFDRFL